MQLWTHFEYLSVASLVPSPWSQLAAHSVVSTAWEELGRATPKQEARQSLRLCKCVQSNWTVTHPYTSLGSQAWTQLIEGEIPGTAVVAGALVTDDSAKAPIARARRAIEYFIF